MSFAEKCSPRKKGRGKNEGKRITTSENTNLSKIIEENEVLEKKIKISEEINAQQKEIIKTLKLKLENEKQMKDKIHEELVSTRSNFKNLEKESETKTEVLLDKIEDYELTIKSLLLKKDELENQNNSLKNKIESLKKQIKDTEKKKKHIELSNNQTIAALRQSNEEFNDIMSSNVSLVKQNTILNEQIENLMLELDTTKSLSKQLESSIGETKVNQQPVLEAIELFANQIDNQKEEITKLYEERKNFTSIANKIYNALTLAIYNLRKSEGSKIDMSLIKVPKAFASVLNNKQSPEVVIQMLIDKMNEHAERNEATLKGLLSELRKLEHNEKKMSGLIDKDFIDFVNEQSRKLGTGKDHVMLSSDDLKARVDELQKYVDEDDPLYQMFIAQFCINIRLTKENTRLIDEMEKRREEVTNKQVNAKDSESKTKEFEKSKETIQKLESENKTLRTELDQAKDLLSKTELKLENSLIQQNNSIDQVAEEIDFYKKKYEESILGLSDLGDEFTKLQKQNTECMNCIMELKSKNSKLKNKIKSMQAANSKEIEDITLYFQEQQNSASQELSNSLTETSLQCSTLQNSNKSMKDCLRNKDFEIEKLETEVKKLRREIIILESDKKNLEQKITRDVRNKEERENAEKIFASKQRREEMSRQKDAIESVVREYKKAAIPLSQTYKIAVDDASDLKQIVQLVLRDINCLRQFQAQAMKP